ncbi:MAG TPA: hypothetical protein VL593_01385 [Ramlibacter sp.]|jgi:hypothetical protein|nr:hypothetical protein [Ramlibacter sp.]
MQKSRVVLNIDLKVLGRLVITPPKPTFRAFGTLPYVRLRQIPVLAVFSFMARIGSFYLCCFNGGIEEPLPMAVYLELRVLPGYSVQAAWFRTQAEWAKNLLMHDD